MPASYPSVAIVILNWNGKHHLQRFLPSVFTTDYPNLRIIIADNASNDGSLNFIEEAFPAAGIIKLKENFGFARGYNEALKQVSADYFVLLNSDVEIEPGWLNPVIALMENNRAIAACQPKVLAFNNKNSFEYAGAAGGWLDAFGYPFARGRIFDLCEVDEGQYNEPEEIFWATGAAMIIRSTVYKDLKGFDEQFFAHQEEIDLCWRIQLAGYKIFCCPQSVVYHVGGGTLPRGNSRKTFLNFRNNQMMLAKNLHWSEKWWKIPFRLMLDQVSALKGLLSGDGGYFVAIIQAHLAFYRWLMFGSRSEAQPVSKKKLSRLKGVYNGNLVWQHFVVHKKTFRSIFIDKKTS